MFSRTFSPFDTRRLLAAGVTVGMLAAVVGAMVVATLAFNSRTAVGAGGPVAFRPARYAPSKAKGCLQTSGASALMSVSSQMYS
jgi:hypothetical protein